MPLYAELDTSETSFLECELLSRMSTCGRHLTWRNRKDFIVRKNKTKRLPVPISLVVTGGPIDGEQKSFKEAHSQDEQWIALHAPATSSSPKQIPPCMATGSYKFLGTTTTGGTRLGVHSGIRNQAHSKGPVDVAWSGKLEGLASDLLTVLSAPTCAHGQAIVEAS